MTPFQLSDADRGVYRRYASLALPRHTSYPSIPYWEQDYGPTRFREDLRRSAGRRNPLSLYVHIPFCERLCYFCTCNREIVPADKRTGSDPSEALLDGLAIEVARFAEVLGETEIHQLHLGGGSPTFLRPAQLSQLFDSLLRRFPLAPGAEVAVELDPRVTTRAHLATLREFGVNRVSLGIQDFAPHVQRAVNRLQPFEQVAEFVGWCRSFGFASINFDLIYGLPFQTLESMAKTLELTLALSPDRIAFYRLAVIPELFRWQNVFRPADLPAGDLSLDLNLLAINRFQAAGYEFIGLDHFAKPDEELAQAHQSGTLRRTFQGMTTGRGLDILGLGPSGASQLEDAYAQNRKTSAAWLQAIPQDLATERGLRLSDDDRLRRDLLQQLYGFGRIDKPALEESFGIVFDDYFAEECDRLRDLIDDRLVEVEQNAIRCTTPLGRLLVRVVAAAFDRYLPAEAFRSGLPASMSSKVG